MVTKIACELVRDLRLLSQGVAGRLVVHLSAVDPAVLALDVYDEIRPGAGTAFRIAIPTDHGMASESVAFE